MILSKMERRSISVCIVAFMLISIAAAATTIKSVETKPADISPKTKFSIKVTFSGEPCGMQAKFYLDDQKFSEKNIGSESDGGCVMDIESQEIDLVNDPVSCGIHKLRVDLVDGGNVINTKAKDLQIGNVPSITITPPQPLPQSEVSITFKDKTTGRPISDLQVQITKLITGTAPKEYSSGTNGVLTFTADTVGNYRMNLEDPNYCGTLDFRVLRKLPYDGPKPANPVVGERIGIAVPISVGIKYIDPDGKVHPLMNLGGGANFTVDKPGQYTLVLADISTVFWRVDLNFTVSARAGMLAKVDPEKPVVNKVVVLTITSRGEPIANTPVKITKPIGGTETLETGSQGDVRFTPDSMGTYHYKVEKARFDTLEGVFDTKNAFDIKIIPREPIADQDILLNVTDQTGAKVSDAVVAVMDASGVLVNDSTGESGSFKFRLTEPREYTIQVRKNNFWGFEDKIDVFGLLNMKLSRNRIEFGESTKIVVTDANGKNMSADVTVTKPDGRSETIKAGSYTPQKVGDYTIKVTKTGYRTVSSDLRVDPHPLNLTAKIEGKKVIVEATSHDAPVKGIMMLIRTPTEEKQVATDQNGLATAAVDREGNLTITANNITVNEEYDVKVMKRRLLKQYSYPLLLIPLAFVILSTLLMVGVIQYAHMQKDKGKKDGGLFYKGARPKAKTSLFNR
jgi:hypothetical protein